MGLIKDRIKNAYNAFMGRDPTVSRGGYYYPSYGTRPDRVSRRIQNERSIVSAIYNRIAVDCESINVCHVRVDEQWNYESTIQSALNEVLTINANIDQTGRTLIQDLVESMLDEGVIALIPIETSSNPNHTDSYDVYSSRVGKIMQWYPKEVRVEVYNELTGKKEEITVEKKYTPIIENPFYAIMNEPNSTLQRLLRTLNQLDEFNARNSAGKMDMIIQLPYIIKSEARQRQAEERRKSIETQLTGSQYGIAYIDGTERVIQLNRGVENNLWNQVKDLKEELFNQMGLCKAIFDGTADEATLLQYHNRTIEPIMTRVTEEIERKWLSRTAYSQLQRIRFFKDPFKLVPVSQLAEIADKFTRNCIMTTNEIRSVIGMKPSNDPTADQLINSNLNQPEKKSPEVEEDIEIEE